jgi:hypothetical protein
MHIIPDPLLNKYRKECCGKVECEGHEPKRIYTDTGCRWAERREWGRWSRGNGNLWSYGSKLVGNLREKGGMLFKVINHLICGANLQVLFAINHKRSEGSRK